MRKCMLRGEILVDRALSKQHPATYHTRVTILDFHEFLYPNELPNTEERSARCSERRYLLFSLGVKDVPTKGASRLAILILLI